jgi:hypothetical protein
MPAQCDVRCIRNDVRKEMTQKSIAHLAVLFPGRSLTKAQVDLFFRHLPKAVRTPPKSGSFDSQYCRERKNRKTGKEGDFC